METAWTELTSLLPDSTGWMHSGVAVLSSGNLLCAHPEGATLLSIDPTGAVEQLETSLTEMHSIVSASHQGNEVIAIADPGHRFIPNADDPASYTDYAREGRAVLLDLRGEEILELQCPDLEAYSDQKWRPTSIAIDDERFGGSGDIWVADGYGASLLHRFAADGKYQHSVDGSETGKVLACPHGIALTINEGVPEIYVADRSNCRLVVLDTSGNFLRCVGEGSLDSPSSLVFTRGRLYVTELFGSIARFENDEFMGTIDGDRLRDHQDDSWPNLLRDQVLGAPEHHTGSFTSPHGITSDDNHLYVTEWHIGGRLLQLSLEHF